MLPVIYGSFLRVISNVGLVFSANTSQVHTQNYCLNYSFGVPHPSTPHPLIPSSPKHRPISDNNSHFFAAAASHAGYSHSTMKQFLLFIAVSFASWTMICGCAQPGERAASAASQPNPPLSVDKVVGGLEQPVALVFLSKNVLLVGERQTGHIRWVQSGVLRAAPFATVPVPNGAGDGEGLLGMVLDTQYPDLPYLYVYHTVPAASGKPLHGEVLRLSVRNGMGVEPQVLIDNLPASGGSLLFAPDGKLFVGVDDSKAQKLDPAQDYTVLAGKVLRYNPDGTIPDDNPFQEQQTPQALRKPKDGVPAGDTTLSDITLRSPVFAIGLRSPGGMADNPDSGELYFTDGENVIEHLIAGDNYGWPQVSGHFDAAEYRQPLWVADASSLTPTGCVFYTGTDFPAWHGNLLFIVRGDGQLRRAIFDGTDHVATVTTVPGTEGLAQLAVTISPDGGVYFSSMNAVYRLKG